MQEDQREIFCKSSVQMKKAGGFEIYQRGKRYWMYETAECGAGGFESANIATGEAEPGLSPASSCFPLPSGILKGEVIPWETCSCGNRETCMETMACMGNVAPHSY